MDKYYITFFGHPNEGYFAVIEAESLEEARDIAHYHYPNGWSTIYTNEQWHGVHPTDDNAAIYKLHIIRCKQINADTFKAVQPRLL